MCDDVADQLTALTINRALTVAGWVGDWAPVICRPRRRLAGSMSTVAERTSMSRLSRRRLGLTQQFAPTDVY